MVVIQEIGEEEEATSSSSTVAKDTTKDSDVAKGDDNEEEVDAAPAAKGDDNEEEVVAAPAAPAMPEMKMSQILPMIVMLGLQKFDLEALGFKRHMEVLFIIVQLLCLGALYFIYDKIQKVPDENGTTLQIPEVKQFGQVIKPAIQQTAKEYDMEKLKEQGKQAGMLFVILGAVYYNWGYLMPLVLQILMTPMQLYESPLFQMHIRGKVQTRPFPTPNPFGLPSAPEAPAKPTKAKANVKDKKDN